ncbi:NAD(P)-binding protein [Mollisia scopiformis]|uniref:NAD(P)-binding protein n=1 Tax=Mollisia scopiformis TaxID=149040 RepID=A0A194XSB8_MOLSC|nr:NAD(P)-binding protein [Mollisia scopiformis]KUJ22934.1 NAD(P)-binding protein [Mollisia scopiformis]
MPSFDPASLSSLSGKVYLVTGGNAGIGYETILHLARKDAKVYMGCRSSTKGNAAIASIHGLVPHADVQLLILDHMDLTSVVSAANELKTKENRLHGLVNNAGIMAVPFETSKDGYESQWQTNYLAHFLLTHHLLPLMLATAKVSTPGDVRIVNVTSGGHATFAPRAGIDFEDTNQTRGGVWSRYGQSKLANVLHAKELNRFYGPDGTKKSEGQIWTAAVHPGHIYTDLSKNAQFAGPLSKPVAATLNCLGVFIPADKGSFTSVFCAASQDMKADMSGEYFVPLGKVGKPSKHANNPDMAEKLWQWTEAEFSKKNFM